MTVCTVLLPGEMTHVKPSGNNDVSFYWFLSRHIYPRSKNTEARFPGLPDKGKPDARCLFLGQELWPKWWGMKPGPQTTTQAGVT